MSKDEKLESNAEYQRRRMMTQDERTTTTRDIIAKNIYDQAQRDNKRTTYEDAQRKAVEVIEKEIRKKNG